MVGGFNGSNATTLIRAQWRMLSRIPGGRRVFSKLMGVVAPYTGSIGAQVEDVRDGYARVTLADRRAVRNHLKCVHAIALANLAEMTGNLAVLYSAPEDTRMIVAGMSMEYLKKARGRITAECSCAIPGRERKEYVNDVVMKDPDGNVVAKAQLRSLIGPRK
jgi:uncharacterized protein (TIGR00369 family)